jgi:DNA modification methylase
MDRAGFGIKEVLLCPTPGPPWASSGFQLGAVHFQRGYKGQITWGWLDNQNSTGATGGNGSADLIIRPSVHVVRASAFAIPLADKSVQTVVTSPSYYRLRMYAGGTENDLGREPTITLYVEHLVMAMQEVWRILRDDGVVFLNLGDSYHCSGRGAGKNGTNDMKMNPLCAGTPLRGQGKDKSLCLIPHRAMIALEADGWIIRNDIIWEKPNAVPDSVKDRCTSSYEHVIVLVKNKKYYWNQKEAQEASVCWDKGSLGGGVTASRKDGKMTAWTMRHSNKIGTSKTEKRLSTGDVLMEDGTVKWHPVGVGPKGDALISDGTHGERTKLSPPIGNIKHQALGKPTLVGHRVEMKPTRNGRDVWHINTRPHKDAHIAMFPEPLVERCIRIGSKEGDLVLDLFAGSGTVGLVARQLGRNCVLMDISEEYVSMMKRRLEGEPPSVTP